MFCQFIYTAVGRSFQNRKATKSRKLPCSSLGILLETERCILDFCVTYVSKQAELDLVHGSGNKAGAKVIKNTK